MLTNGISDEQYAVLMKPLNPSRVKQRQGMAYLESWDVRAHLIRIFGFGGFDVVADEAELVSHREGQGQSGKNHEVCWKVQVTLRIHSLGAVYSEYAIGSSSQPSLPEAHDMAIKTAESDALKRCAINLGTQFGLGLYDDGSTREVIRRTLVGPDGFTRVKDEPSHEQDNAEHGQGDDTPHTPAEDGTDWLAWARTISTQPLTQRVNEIAKVNATIPKDRLIEYPAGSHITIGRLVELALAGKVES